MCRCIQTLRSPASRRPPPCGVSGRATPAEVIEAACDCLLAGRIGRITLEDVRSPGRRSESGRRRRHRSRIVPGRRHRRIPGSGPSGSSSQDAGRDAPIAGAAEARQPPRLVPHPALPRTGASDESNPSRSDFASSASIAIALLRPAALERRRAIPTRAAGHDPRSRRNSCSASAGLPLQDQHKTVRSMGASGRSRRQRQQRAVSVDRFRQTALLRERTGRELGDKGRLGKRTCELRSGGFRQTEIREPQAVPRLSVAWSQYGRPPIPLARLLRFPQRVERATQSQGRLRIAGREFLRLRADTRQPHPGASSCRRSRPRNRFGTNRVAVQPQSLRNASAASGIVAGTRAASARDCSGARRSRDGAPAACRRPPRRRENRSWPEPGGPPPGAIPNVAAGSGCATAGIQTASDREKRARAYQYSFSPNWTSRGGVVAEILPKDGSAEGPLSGRIEVGAVECVEHLGPELQLQDLAPVEPLLNSDVEDLQIPAPGRSDMYRGALPKVNGAGCWNAVVLNHC